MASRNFSDSFHILNDLFKLIRTETPSIKRRIIISTFLMGITIFLNVISPLFLKKLIGSLSSFEISRKTDLVVVLGFLYGFSWTLSQITMQLREIISFRVIERVIRRLTLRVFDKIIHQPYSHFLRNQLGEKIDIINKAREGFPYLISGLFFYLIPTIIEIILACTVLGFFLPLKFIFMFLLMLLLYVVYSIWGIEKSSFYQDKSIEISHKSYSHFVDRLLNYEVIKIFCSQKLETKQLDTLLKKAEEAQTKASVFIEGIRLGQGGILGLSLLLLTLMSIWAFLGGSIELEGIILVNAYFMQLISPLGYFGLIVKDIKNGLIHTKMAYEILMSEEEDTKKKLPPFNFQTIRFNNVFFRYEKERDLLKGIDLSLEIGKVTALVGETGSGKSTIAKLLFRFYSPDKGNIFIGKKNYLNVDSHFIRENISYVPQDPTLFCDTILFNITYGSQDASEAEIKEALKKAQLTDWINKLPQGLNTMIGERSLNLSGGEKQRLAIARAFLTKRKFYVFDESTSALDPKTQFLIYKHILGLKQKAGVLIISHRLQTIVDSDEIVVLSNGKVVERGMHTNLLSLNKHYSDLWQKSFFNKIGERV